MAQRVDRGIALLFHDRGTRRGEWSAGRPGRTLPPGKTPYPLHRRLGGPQGRSGRAENLVPTGIRSRTVQPVAQLLYDCPHFPSSISSKTCDVSYFVPLHTSFTAFNSYSTMFKPSLFHKKVSQNLKQWGKTVQGWCELEVKLLWR